MFLHNLVLLFVGPLPETQTGLKYVLTLTDYFTKYVELFPLRQKSGLCVARGLKSYIYQGREFVNQLNTDLVKRFDINRMITAAYHPQTNGLDERYYQYSRCNVM